MLLAAFIALIFCTCVGQSTSSRAADHRLTSTAATAASRPSVSSFVRRDAVDRADAADAAEPDGRPGAPEQVVVNLQPKLFAIGDSYSAGPGAGPDYDQQHINDKPCFRSKGAYPYFLQDLLKFRLWFLSCSGHVTSDVGPSQLINSRHGLDSDIVTLSIGGNDLGFSDIALWCLVLPPIIVRREKKCREAKADAWNLIEDRDGKDTFYRSLASVWNDIYFDPARYSKDVGLQVPRTFQTLYPRFFNADTDGCSGARILKLGPLLSRTLRGEINGMVDAANAKIRDSLRRWMSDPPPTFLRPKRVELYDPNPLYDGHRLCEAHTGGVPGFSHDESWFLGVASSDSAETPDGAEAPGEVSNLHDELRRFGPPDACDPGSENITHAIGCSLSRALASDNVTVQREAVRFLRVTDTAERTSLAEWVMKAFHPKTNAHRATAQGLYRLIRGEDESGTALRKRNVPLRVLPLGDSITNGFASSDNNGYRKKFFDLEKLTGPIDMIGSHKGRGAMEDNDEEGWDTFTIDQIAQKADNALRGHPNVVLLHAGTNNMGSDAEAAAAPAKLALLIDKTVLLCSTIIPSSDPARQARNERYNAAVRSLIETRQTQGKKVIHMNMDEVVRADELSDGIHPNDEGYIDMAMRWLLGVEEANSLGWLSMPQGDGYVPAAADPAPVPEYCPNRYRRGREFCSANAHWIPQGEIANGAGMGGAVGFGRTCFPAMCREGVYDRMDECKAKCVTGTCASRTIWSQIGPVGDRITCSRCGRLPQFPHMCTCHNGNGQWELIQNPRDTIDQTCDRLTYAHYDNAVHFADLDGDGRDDWIWMNDEGALSWWRNTGDPPNRYDRAGLVHWGPQGLAAGGVGARGDQIILADMDGDGRADYVWITAEGRATIWWNRCYDAGKPDWKITWWPQAGEYLAPGIGDGRGVRLADVNGDGKADFIHLDERDASMTLYMNLGRRDDSGLWMFEPWGKVALGVHGDANPGGRDAVRFADMNGDGRADYLVIKQQTGAIQAWYNRGPGDNSDAAWRRPQPINWWNTSYDTGRDIAEGVSNLRTWTDGRMVVFGDLNGDGRDDYMYIDTKTSATEGYLNAC